MTRNGTYDDQDRLITYGGSTYNYDPLGRLETVSTAGAVTRYRYEPFGALAEVELPNGQRVGYLTDGHGRRVGKRIDGELVQGFLYADALRPVAELDGSGAVISRFVYAGGNVPAYMVKGADTYRLITDGAGSVRRVVQVGTGNVVQERDYDAFGNPTLDTNPGFQPFGFAGGLHDRTTGLVRFGARDYDPVTGRFTTPDPIGFAGGSTNLYTYAGNDPVNNADPTGLEIDWYSCAAGVVSGAVNGAVDTLDIVFPIRALINPIGDGIRLVLEQLGVGSYRDMTDVAIDALDLEVFISRDSTEFMAGEVCGAVGAAAATGGTGAAGAPQGTARAVTSGATRALASGTRSGGLTVISVREAEVGIARVLDREAAALERAAAQQVERVAQSEGLQLVRPSQAPVHVPWWRRVPRGR